MKKLMAVAVGVVFAFGTIGPAAATPNACNGLDVNDDRATDVADFLSGSAGRDVIALGDGNDQYFAAEGGDILCGNAGDDILVGEAGSDELSGGTEDDTLVGMPGADTLAGGDGADILNGGAGPDILNASTDDGLRDVIYDGFGSDTIIGNAEDVWCRADDGVTDDRDAFSGTIVADTEC